MKKNLTVGLNLNENVLINSLKLNKICQLHSCTICKKPCYCFNSV